MSARFQASRRLVKLYGPEAEQAFAQRANEQSTDTEIQQAMQLAASVYEGSLEELCEERHRVTGPAGFSFPVED